MTTTGGRAIRKRAKALSVAALDFKDELIRHRKKHLLSQNDVAERMGVSQPTVSELERYDSNPTLRTLRKYANAIEVRVEYKVIDDCGDHDRSDPAIMNKELAWTERASATGQNNVRLRLAPQAPWARNWSEGSDREPVAR